MKFIGTATAIVTPFNPDGTIDFKALEGLIEYQIEGGVEGIVPCGSTGEAATQSSEEKLSVIRFAIEKAAGRVKIIAGTGSNDTAASIKLTKEAQALGADAVLLVGPYYNKPTQNGHFEHFRAIADATDIPMIIYNVPPRTGSNMLAETQLRIAEYSPKFIATKEASANLEQIQEIIRSAPEHFSVLSGDDSLSLPVIACGGVGTIAVVSNYAPRLYSDGIRAALAHNFTQARELLYSLLPLMKLNFIESNPIPVKAALHLMGKIQEVYRLPLTPLPAAAKEKISAALAEIGLL